MNRRGFVTLALAISALTVWAAGPATSNVPPAAGLRSDNSGSSVKVPGNAPPKPVSGPVRLEQSKHLVLDTNAIVAAATGTNNPSTQKKSFTWKVDWKGWDGLQFEAVQKTPFKNPLETLGWLPEGNSPQPQSYLRS